MSDTFLYQPDKTPWQQGAEKAAAEPAPAEASPGAPEASAATAPALPDGAGRADGPAAAPPEPPVEAYLTDGPIPHPPPAGPSEVSAGAPFAAEALAPVAEEEAVPFTAAPPAPASPARPRREPTTGPLTGRMLKHFRVGNRIAGGGMGEVYLAFDTYLERPVAIKTVRLELARDDVRRTLFLREAQAQAKVVHPHVAQVYFAGEEAGVWFIAMQLVDGGSLADLVEEKKHLTWQDAARHMLGVAEGLAEAARLGIIHRDIKPANILLDRSGEAHLADFGLASLQGPRPPGSPSARDGASPTPLGAVMGTLEYMAPEQLRGGPLDSRADMYALGATFYHLLAGRPPLTASSLQEAAVAHSGPAPRKLRRVARRVPRALAEVIDRCLERDRERRYRNFEDLVQALRRAGPPVDVPAGVASRGVAWIIDLLPAAVVLRYTYATFPSAALLAAVALAAIAVPVLGATPGLWLMRLCLRASDGSDASALRAGVRALVLFGWLLPTCEFLRASYGSSRYAEDWGIAGVAWAALSALGSLGALFGGQQTLHDKLSGTRVLVDTR